MSSTPFPDTGSTGRTGHTGSAVTVRGALAHQWKAAIATFAIVLILGIVVAALWPAKTTAAATVLVYPVAGEGDGSATRVNIATEARAARSSVVLERAASQAGVDSAALGRAVRVEPADDAQYLTVEAEERDAAAASREANAVAQAYLQVRGERASTLVQGSMERLQKELDAVRDKAPKTSAAPFDSQRATLSALNVIPGAVISPATVGAAESTPMLMYGTAAGVVLGLVCALAVALLRERRSTRALDAARVASRTGRRVLDWDGGREGARALLDEPLAAGADTAPGADARPAEAAARTVIVSGEEPAADQMAEALGEVLTERGHDVRLLTVGDAEAADRGDAAGWLQAPEPGVWTVATVDPRLGTARARRLAAHGRSVLVVGPGTDLGQVEQALHGPAGAATQVVFASATGAAGTGRTRDEARTVPA